MLLLIGAVVLCAVVIGLGRGIIFPPRQMAADVGNEPPFLAEGRTATFETFFGFDTREQWEERTFRWTHGRGTITFPAALRMGQSIVEVTLCGCREESPPRPFTLLINNEPMLVEAAPSQWRRYHILAPPDLTHPDYSVMLDVRSPTWVDASDRTLGMAIDAFAIRQARGTPLGDIGSLAVAVGGILFAVWRWRSLAVGGLVGGGWLAVVASYQPHFLPQPVLASAAVGGILLFWLITLPRNGNRLTRLIPLIAAPLLSLWLVFSPQLLGFWIVDDAFVSFQYARHFEAGHGLVYNVGERVEGYTNFLWTMLFPTVFALDGDPVLASACINLILGFAIIALTMLLSRRLMPMPWEWASATLLAVSGPFLMYTTRGSGMETALFTTLLLVAMVLLTRERWGWAGIFLALTMMTRPDGVVFAGVAGLYALWQGWRSQGGRSLIRIIRPALTLALPLIGLYGSYFLWRWSYYGYLLPNTFYVKVGGTWAQALRGGEYLWTFATTHVLFLVMVGGVASGGWRCFRSRRLPSGWQIGTLLAAMVTIFTLYIVAVGGDWVPGARFFIPLLPLLTLLGVWGMAEWANGRMAAVGGALIAGVAIILVLLLPRESSYLPGTPVWAGMEIVKQYRETGRWINSHTPPDTLIAATAGALPYYADRPVIDALGLTDLHIAHLPVPDIGAGKAGHEKMDADYVFGREPAIVPYKGSSIFWHHPSFKEDYHYNAFDGPEGRAVKLYIRNDFSFDALNSSSPTALDTRCGAWTAAPLALVPLGRIAGLR